MKLMTEETFENISYITEGSDGSQKNLFIEGIFMQGDVKNRNGRIYPSPILEKQMKFYTENYINKNRSLGELNHPSGPNINLDKVSHMITSMKREGSNFVGKAQIIDTPMGNIARKLIEAGAGLGVSTRGLGTVKQSGGAMVVQEDFVLNTVDIVAQPSAHDAWVNGIMENAEWVYDAETGNVKRIQIAEEIKKEFSNTKNITEEQIIRNFNKFLKSV